MLILALAVLLLPSMAWAGSCSLAEPPVYVRASVPFAWREGRTQLSVWPGVRGRLCDPQGQDGSQTHAVEWEAVRAFTPGVGAVIVRGFAADRVPSAVIREEEPLCQDR